MSESTQQFLRPLVDTDPATVRVHRDAQAERLAAAHAADAVTVGHDVFLGAGHTATPESPETLGLLAHEVAHVAQNRETAADLPAGADLPATPATRSGEQGERTGRDEAADPDVVGRPGSAPAAEPQRGPAPSSTTEAAATIEAAETTEAAQDEARAQAVERRAIRVARANQAQGLPPDHTIDTRSLVAGGASLDDASAGPSAESVRPVPSVPSVPLADEAAGAPWGGLPAPWEPLPEWLAPSLMADVENGASAAVAVPPPSPVAGAPTSSAIAGAPAPATESRSIGSQGHTGGQGGQSGESGESGQSGGAAVQTAPVGRSTSDTSEEASASAAGHEDGARVEPDLDALARQVYAVLRRRLAAESRRVGYAG